MVRFITVSAGVLGIAALYLGPNLQEAQIGAVQADTPDQPEVTRSVQDPWFRGFEFSLGRERAVPGGISDTEAVEIAVLRGATIREARRDGRTLTDLEIAAIGVNAPPAPEVEETSVDVASNDPAAGLGEIIIPASANATEAAAPAVDLWQVTGSSVNLRAGPGTSHDIITQAALNDRVEPLTDTGADWIQIRLETGETAWIYGKFLSPTD